MRWWADQMCATPDVPCRIDNSPVTGDCHAGIRGGRGGNPPGPLDRDGETTVWRGHTKVDTHYTPFAAAVNLATLATLDVTHTTERLGTLTNYMGGYAPR